MPTSADYGSLPFDEQIQFFRQKTNVDTAAWTDIYAAEHNHAFMVAGAKGDLLTDMRGAVDKFIAEGKTIDEFRKDFDDIVQRHGWAYNGGRNWRTRVIYDTNLRQSYHAGREAQMADPALRRERPYGLYRHGGSSDPRPDHLAWDGTVLPLDDPWWSTYTPQNGWGCSCKKFTLSERDVQRMGLTVADQAPDIEWEEKTVGVRGPNPRTVRVPKGIDPGFEYRPDATNRIKALTPRSLDVEDLFYYGKGNKATDVLPGRPPTTDEIPVNGLDEEEISQAFLNAGGANQREAFLAEDVLGELIPMSRDFFKDTRGNWKFKNDRQNHLHLLIDTLFDPDEIWVSWDDRSKSPRLKRKYVRRFPDDLGGLSVLQFTKDGWAAVTSFQVSRKTLEKNSADSVDDYLNEQRRGLRVYKRGK